MLLVGVVALALAAALPATQQPHATVAFVRHGQSQWNAASRFTGWTDVDLTDLGRQEAALGGAALQRHGLSFDRAFTSELKRAQETLAIVLHHSEQFSVPTMRHWRLNERHYGQLQGRSKQECVDTFGVEQVKLWRNSFDTPPPLVGEASPAFPGNDPKYAHVPREHLPRGECLRDTAERCMPFWDEHVTPLLREGQRVLITAHGHSIRALVKHLECISDDGIASVSIPNGIPYVVSLDEHLRPIRREGGESGDGIMGLSGTFLGSHEKVAAADWLLSSKKQ